MTEFSLSWLRATSRKRLLSLNYLRSLVSAKTKTEGRSGNKTKMNKMYLAVAACTLIYLLQGCASSRSQLLCVTDQNHIELMSLREMDLADAENSIHRRIRCSMEELRCLVVCACLNAGWFDGLLSVFIFAYRHGGRREQE